MKVAFLTSSRADFGIYLPLLKTMSSDPFFDIGLIAFGTHLSSFHGHTIEHVIKERFRIDYTIETTLASDTEESISTSMALTSLKFSSLWKEAKNKYDLVFCLGDRYEMFAAVSSAVPFGISFAHIHGGETTLGAIDNQFRHCLTIFSSLHFAATEDYAVKIKDLTENSTNVYVTGALSLDNLDNIPLLSPDEFYARYGIDISKPSILITYHPETMGSKRNEENIKELLRALDQLSSYQLIITMPNADSEGNVFRKNLGVFAVSKNNVCLVENFGTQGYFSCMHHSKLIVGNSSSGIIEAASFKKFVVNIGDRQRGRSTSPNVIHCEPLAPDIFNACQKALGLNEYQGKNIYFKGGAVKKIVEALKLWKQ
jgi:GDP/UDP-N,N'-diacetylbacillosamine 2-epimerase (hydrolysing)